MHNDIKETLYTSEQIAERVAQMGAQISADYAGKGDIVVISVLRGAFIFMADQVRAIDLPAEMDFMSVSSYGNASTSSGNVRIVKDITTSIEGKHVIIAEDILDSGLTLNALIPMLLERKPASLEIAAFLHKLDAQKVEVPCKYVGFTCPNEYIVGYGLDYAEQYRNLPYIGVLKPEIYQ